MTNANFTPDIGPYTQLKPFRFWCQKVLPLVYDDSLSYYELLGKVIDYLNKTMEDVDTQITDIQGLLSAYEALQGWVNAYYTSADFAAAIDAGLDRMAESGQLTTLLTAIVNPELPNLVDDLLPEVVLTLLPDEVSSQIGGTVQTQLPAVVSNQIGGTVQTQLPSVVSSQIPGTVANQLPAVVSNQIGPVVEDKIVDPVEDWLDANVSGGIAVDRTLAILGAGADAAFTGARLKTLDNAAGYEHIADTGFIITTDYPYAFNYEVINNNDGFSDQGTHTYKMIVVPVNTGDKYCINAHKISVTETENHFAVTYAFCAKHIGDPDADIPYYLPTTYSRNNVENLIVTVPEITIPTGQAYDETTGYLVVITANIQDPVYKLVDEGLHKDVNDLKSDFNEIDNYIFEENPSPVLLNAITGINAKPGWNASDGSQSIPCSQNASYDMYWFVTEEDVDIWFDSISASYFAVSVGGTYTGTQESGTSFWVYCNNGSTRYVKGTDLPTENNKLHVPAGCPIAFTVTAGGMESVNGIGVTKSVKQSFKNEILSGIDSEKKPCLRYVGTSGADLSTERVEIYIPTVVGYVRYDFLHTVDAAHNANIWRIGYATHTDDSMTADFPITTVGEWECAVHLADRDDFSGGYAHGDEVLNNIAFLVDGKVVDITSVTDITPFSRLNITQDSNFYDPADHTTVYAKHGSIHIFDENGVTVKQTFQFLAQETVTSMYMAMLPIAKTVSNMIVPNNDYTPLDTSTARRLYNTTETLIYKTTGNVVAEFSVPQFEYLSPTDFTFLCLDNGSTEYNKCYYCNNLSSYQVSANKLMKSETRYNFIVSD